MEKLRVTRSTIVIWLEQEMKYAKLLEEFGATKDAVKNSVYSRGRVDAVKNILSFFDRHCS